MNKKEVCIIGAGPVGCYTAMELAKKGIDVEVFEEHAEIGMPVACTGLVTESIKEIMQIKKEFLVNEIKNAEIFCGNKSVKIKLNEYVLDRYKFDSYLAECAKDCGAKIYTNHKVIGIENHNLIIKNLNKIGFNKIRCKIKDNNNDKSEDENTDQKRYGEIIRLKKSHIIGADGPSSLVGRIINPEKQLKHYVGKQMLFKGNFEKDTFQIFLGDICPNFFGWVVPESEEIARVGVASEQPNKYFEMFINDLMKKNVVKEKISLQAGPIPIFNSNYNVYKQLRTEKENNNNNAIKDSQIVYLQSANTHYYTHYYIVGDAAGHVKATTGGGIVPGLRCAKILAESIAEGNDYEKGIRKIKRELKTHLMLRNLLNKFSEKDYLELLQSLEKEGVKSILEKHSRDSSIKLLTQLFFSEPKLAKFVLKMRL